MATNHTSGYNLNQWVKSDRVLMEEFNEDNRKIDAALNSLSSGLAGKASAAELDTLKSTVNEKADTIILNSLRITVNGKASQSDLDALKTTVNGKASTSSLNSLKSTVTSLQTAVNKKQDSASAVRLVRGSYTGTGASGSKTPTSLSFSGSLGKLPELLIIRPVHGVGTGLVLIQGMESSNHNMSGAFSSSSRVEVTWNASAKTVSWWANNESAQLNDTDIVYFYFAIG